jgi:ribosomal protein S18 acetylase RimI-like enzyme
MIQPFGLRPAHLSDLQKILSLYKTVSAQSGGIIRMPSEITEEYVLNFLESSLQTGICIVAEMENQIVGEIHAYACDLQSFRHILAELTIVVHPDFQSQSIGKALFVKFLNMVRVDFLHILLVELFVRENNQKAVHFYQSLGFEIHGRLVNYIKNPDGSLETPLQMMWKNPNYDENSR